MLRAFIERLVAPGYGCCRRCRRPWKFAQPHTTMVTQSRGVFALCERCWRELGGSLERIPFYRALWEHWLAGGYGSETASWAEIESAVVAEAQGARSDS